MNARASFRAAGPSVVVVAAVAAVAASGCSGERAADPGRATAESTRSTPTPALPGPNTPDPAAADPNVPDPLAPGPNTPDPAAADPNAPDPKAPDPDVVTRASPPYRPGPSVTARGKVDGAALRRRVAERLRDDTGPVTVLRGDDALSLGKRICQAVVPRVPAHVPVLLEPNIGGFAWFKNPDRSGGDNGVTGRTTDPEFVRGVIRCLKERGHTRITVADGWAAEARHWDRLVRTSGYRAMTEAEGVALVAMNDDGVFDAGEDAPGKPLAITGMEGTTVPTLLMPKILAEHLDHGLFISLPKIKTHRFSVVSLAIKGRQGTVMYSDRSPAYRQKWRSHRELGPYLDGKKKGQDDRAAYVAALEIFARRMVDVLAVEAPHVVLAEGAPAMSGDGFNILVPTGPHVAIGGTNPVLVDRVGAQWLGMWKNPALARELGGHDTSPLIELAAERFSLDLDAVRVQGDGAELLASPRPVRFVAMAPFTIETPGETGVTGAGGAGGTAAPTPPDGAGSTVRGDGDGKPAARAAPLGSASIALDGVADEAIWRIAPEAVWDTDYAGRSTGIVTRARFAWSERALYALFVLDGTDLFVDTARPTDVERENLYQEDCVELFLVPDPARLGHYYEVEIGPFGHWFDLELDRSTRPRRRLGWSSGAQIGATQDRAARRAVIEVALTAPDIARLLKPGARLPMGLYRMEGERPRRYLAWSPPRTARPRFHVPEAFGTLVVEGP